MFFEYETKRLVLKILQSDAAPMVLDFYNRDRELFEMYETARVPDFYTISHHQKLLDYGYKATLKMSYIRFYVFLKNNPNQIIGTVCIHGITRLYYQSCELGYKFSSAFHGQGYAYEAIQRCIRIAFEELNLHRITAMVCIGNDSSVRLLHRLGFHEEGIMRDYLLLHGNWKDHICFSLLCNDYISSLQNQ